MPKSGLSKQGNPVDQGIESTYTSATTPSGSIAICTIVAGCVAHIHVWRYQQQHPAAKYANKENNAQWHRTRLMLDHLRNLARLTVQHLADCLAAYYAGCIGDMSVQCAKRVGKNAVIACVQLICHNTTLHMLLTSWHPSFNCHAVYCCHEAF